MTRSTSRVWLGGSQGLARRMRMAEAFGRGVRGRQRFDWMCGVKEPCGA